MSPISNFCLRMEWFSWICLKSQRCEWNIESLFIKITPNFHTLILSRNVPSLEYGAFNLEHSNRVTFGTFGTWFLRIWRLFGTFERCSKIFGTIQFFNTWSALNLEHGSSDDDYFSELYKILKNTCFPANKISISS